MGYKLNGVNTGGIPIDLMRRYRMAGDIRVFIETGTAGGESVQAASELFEICHTIEVVPGRPFMQFAENVTLHEGDSAALIESIANKYKDEPILFWLDAHWSEPHESSDGVNECPVIDEIKAIRKCQKSVIMIDDARLFFGPPPWPCDPNKWPRFMHVFDALRAHFPDHIVTVIDDYIIAFPNEYRDVHYSEWRERYNLRYPGPEAILKKSVSMTWDFIMNYINKQ